MAINSIAYRSKGASMDLHDSAAVADGGDHLLTDLTPLIDTLTVIDVELEDATDQNLRLLLAAIKLLQLKAGDEPIQALRTLFPGIFARLDNLPALKSRQHEPTIYPSAVSTVADSPRLIFRGAADSTRG